MAENFEGATTLTWAERDWYIRDTSWRKGGPIASGLWSKANVSASGANLTLSVAPGESPGGWTGMVGAEIVSKDTVGYGDYSASFAVNLEGFDANAAFGLTVLDWDSEAGPNASEADLIALSRWGADKPAPAEARFTGYSDTAKGAFGNGTAYQLSDAYHALRVELHWAPGVLQWRLFNNATGKLIHETSSAVNVPTPTATTRLHLAMWAYGLEKEASLSGSALAVADGLTYAPADVVFPPPPQPPATKPLPLLDAEGFSAGVNGQISPADPRLQPLLDGATTAIRRYCGWHVAPRFKETVQLDTDGGRLLQLPTLRVHEIEKIEVDGVELDKKTFRWTPKGMVELVDPRTSFPSGFQRVRVTMTHGFDSAPDVAQVVRQIVANAISSSMGATREQAGQVSVSWSLTAPNVAGGISLLARDLAVLDSYRLPGRL
jgi:hypothetical protein